MNNTTYEQLKIAQSIADTVRGQFKIRAGIPILQERYILYNYVTSNGKMSKEELKARLKKLYKIIILRVKEQRKEK